MALATAAVIAGGAFSAASSILGGQAQSKSLKAQGNFDAEVYSQQAEMMKEQQKISDLQFLRSSNNARGTIAAKTAGKGLRLSGSPLAVMLDNESQMQFDKAIGDYNNQIQQHYVQSARTATLYDANQKVRLASFGGYSNAFSTLMNTGYMAGRL